MKALTTALTILSIACSVHANEYHVSKSGLDTNPGTKSRPFKTISAAAAIAQPGDTITVHEGIYREEIAPPRGGTSDDNRITYQAAPGEHVEIRGSDVVSGWEEEPDGVWKTQVSNFLFGDFNPFADEVTGDWFDPKGRTHHTGCVYQDGQWLFEAASKEGLKDVKWKKAWFAEVDKEATIIWATFNGSNPNDSVTEVNVRQTVFYPRKPFLNYITVRGFRMRHAAPKWAPPTAEQMGLVGTHWSKGWIIENNEISHSINTGISLGKYGDEFDNRDATAKAYLDAIDRAREDMKWNKDNIGSHIIRNNEISYCQQAGMVGSMGASFSRITGNTIHHIHTQKRFSGAEMAGIKFHAPIDMLIQNNRIYETTLALWLDWMTQGTRVTGNLMYRNGMDMYYEVNHGPFVIDNNICLSDASRHLSQGGAYVHNLFACRWGNWMDERETPYFKPRSTDKIDDHHMNIGDDRFYNNLFIGNGNDPLIITKKETHKPHYYSYGLKCYEFRPQLPSTGGNVYYNKAAPCSNETALVFDDDPGIKLIEQGDEIFLQMTINEKQKDSKRSQVNTPLLGKAEVTQAPFQNYDGSPLTIDTDYFGNKRDLNNPSAGPFENPGTGQVKLKVWPKEKCKL